MNKSERFWDKQAGRDDQQGEAGDRTFNRAVTLAKKHLKNSDIVLDYGCGTGTLALEFANLVQTIDGIDISSKMIEIAQSKADAQQIENVSFVKADIYRDSYQANSFDVILAFNILHLLENPRRVIQRINQLLKSGGLFMSTTTCMGESRSFLPVFLYFLSKIGVVPQINRFKISQLESLVSDHGFQFVETEELASPYSEYFIAAKKI